MHAPALYKLSPPQVHGQLPRSRALAALEAALARSSVVWLWGLPGAGKSSLAAQWLASRADAGSRCVWYRLDEDDSDVAGLLDALRHHPQHGAPQAMPAWSPGQGLELRAFARRFFRQWLQANEGSLLLCFDDCHRLGEVSPFFELVAAAREIDDERLRFLLLSRRPPPPLLASGQVPGWLTLVDDLALEPAEAAAVAASVSGRVWTEAELAPAQGWMAHVLALARADGGRPGTAQLLGDYLGDELLALLPPDERRGLRLAAELPELPRGLVQLTPAQARLLDQLAERRYFIDASAESWRLHDLLRDGLRKRSLESETPAELARARRELAASVRTRWPAMAMGLFVAANDEEAALDLLDEQGATWLAQGRHRQLLDWLAALPQTEQDQEPRRLLWQAEALLPVSPEAARPLFAMARSWLARDGNAAAAYRAWCGEVGSYVVQWGAVQGLAQLVDELEALQEKLGPPPGEWRWRCAADALTALMYGRAEDPRIRHYAEATAQAIELAEEPAARVMAAAQLLIYKLWWAGDFPGGRALYASFDAEVEDGDHLPPLARLVWWSNATIVDWQCGEPARCHALVERGLALAEASGVHVRDFFLLTQGIFCALSTGDWPRAESYLARLARTERGHRRLDTMVHHFFRSWYALSRGDAALALAHARTALPLAEELGSLFHKVIVLSALAPARLHTGDLEGAVEAYRAQLALAKGSQNPTFAYIAFCAGAEIALVSGDEDGLRKQIERMLMIKHLGGFHSDCGWRDSVRSSLLAFALNHRVMPQVAEQWIREKRLAPPPDYAGSTWPMPVRIRALQGLEVDLDEPGTEVPTGAKPPAKLRDLLAVLVVRHAQGATQAELTDWLWPDADGDKAAASLKVAVHRLRSWLGFEAVLLKNGVLMLNEQRVACDLWLLTPDLSASQADSLLAGCTLPPVQQLRARLQRR